MESTGIAEVSSRVVYTGHHSLSQSEIFFFTRASALVTVNLYVWDRTTGAVLVNTYCVPPVDFSWMECGPLQFASPIGHNVEVAVDPTAATGVAVDIDYVSIHEVISGHPHIRPRG